VLGGADGADEGSGIGRRPDIERQRPDAVGLPIRQEELRWSLVADAAVLRIADEPHDLDAKWDVLADAQPDASADNPVAKAELPRKCFVDHGDLWRTGAGDSPIEASPDRFRPMPRGPGLIASGDLDEPAGAAERRRAQPGPGRAGGGGRLPLVLEQTHD
jgi:hypothetical protein